MRLSAKKKTIITETVKSEFGVNSQVILFGSRVDDTKRGGDIDLLVKTSLDAKISTLVRIKRLLGDQRIDLVVTSTQETEDRLVVAEAINNGVLL